VARRTRILYIQHAGAIGGSAMSLYYTVRGLNVERYEPMVALIRPAEELRELYRRAGAEVIDWPGVVTFEHTTAHWCSLGRPLCWVHQYKLGVGLGRSMARVEALAEATRPDLVHLNSVVLFPAAVALWRRNRRFIWHVREHPVPGHLGLRRRLLGWGLMNLPAEVIFLSEADRSAWVRGERGVVVENYVDFDAMQTAERSAARVRLGLPADAPVLLYLGGLSRMKGVFVLLQALVELQRRLPGLRCLMPGGVYPPPASWKSRVARATLPLVGSGTEGQTAERFIAEQGLAEVCRRSPVTTEVADHFAAADLVLFPATEPHFGRPIIEGAAAGIPAVASDLPGASDLIVDGVTGLLVPAGDAGRLADAVAQVLADEGGRRAMGQAARAAARERFDVARGVSRIEALYEQTLGERPRQPPVRASH